MTKAMDVLLVSPRKRHWKRESCTVAAVDGTHTCKIHTRTADPHCKCKADNLLVFYCIAQSIFPYSKEKKWRPFWIFPLKTANGEPTVSTFRREAEHNLTPALLKCQCLQSLLHTNRILWPICKCIYWPFSWDHKKGEHVHSCKDRTFS